MYETLFMGYWSEIVLFSRISSVAKSLKSITDSYLMLTSFYRKSINKCIFSFL